MLVEVQIMRENTGNWKYDIKADKELINPDHIIRIKPNPYQDKGNVFFVYLVGVDAKYPLVINKASFDNICNKQGGV